MTKVYVAGKLNADAPNYIKNCHAMITKAERIRRFGFSVYVPCLDFLSGLVAGDYEYSDYFENNIAWLECADFLFVCPHSEDSTGTQAEIEHAKKKGIPIAYSMDELIKLKAEKKAEAK